MLGLDLTPACVQLVELQQFKSGRWALQACATEPLAPGCLQDGNIENHEETVAAVRRLLAKNRTATKAVAMALPDTAVLARRVGLSAALSPAQIALQVEFEADRHIPFERAEICLDHCIIGPRADDAQTVDVLLVAARQARVQELQDLAQAVGLALHVLDVASYAAHRAAARVLCLEPDGEQLLVALVELGPLHMHLQVIQGQQVVYTRDQNLDLSGAPLPTRLPFGAANHEDHAWLAHAEKLAAEISRSLLAFSSAAAHQSVDLVLLAGDSPVLPTLARIASGRLGIPCQLVNPFTGMQSNVALPLAQAPAFLRACGLAMRSVPQ
jgi:type IV pilus assembly protein PilM